LQKEIADEEFDVVNAADTVEQKAVREKSSRRKKDPRKIGNATPKKKCISQLYMKKAEIVSNTNWCRKKFDVTF
jgi:hypothetical protein